VAQIEKPRLSQSFACKNAVVLAHGGLYAPSFDWAQGGPIIEREKLAICIGRKQWLAFSDDTENAGVQGPTPLIAAMRCYVASKLGYDVDVPEELIK
jgi:hypothetical protein